MWKDAYVLCAVFGSDYPLPAMAVVVHTSKLRSMGYITKTEEKLLDEIYHYNPLLFDIVTKRVVRSPTTGKKYLTSAFIRNMVTIMNSCWSLMSSFI